MTRVLLIGIAPDAVDYSDPALPPGINAETIQAGIDLGLTLMTERGWEADFCSILPDDTAGPTVEKALAATTYDCIVIGGGVRIPPKNLELFEKLVNTVAKAAPGAPLAFNTSPEDTPDAAARWIHDGKSVGTD